MRTHYIVVVHGTSYEVPVYEHPDKETARNYAMSLTGLTAMDRALFGIRVTDISRDRELIAPVCATLVTCHDNVPVEREFVTYFESELEPFAAATCDETACELAEEGVLTEVNQVCAELLLEADRGGVTLRDAAALSLREIGGWPYAEITDVLDFEKESTSRDAISEVRKKLPHIMRKYRQRLERVSRVVKGNESHYMQDRDIKILSRGEHFASMVETYQSQGLNRKQAEEAARQAIVDLVERESEDREHIQSSQRGVA